MSTSFILKHFTIKFFIIFLLIFCIQALQITSVVYNPKKRNIGVGEELDSYTIEIFFDGKIYLEKDGIRNMLKNFDFRFKNEIGNPINFKLPNNSLSLCLGKSNQMCSVLPKGLENLAGIFHLECGNGKSVKSIPNNGEIVNYVNGYGGKNHDWLIPIPSTDQPFDSLIQQFGWVDKESDEIIDNKLSFLVFNSYTRSYNQRSMKYFFDSRPSIDELNDCRIKMNNHGKNGHKIVDEYGNDPIIGNISPIRHNQNIFCNSEIIRYLKTKIEDIKSRFLNVSDWFFFYFFFF